jgi:hypothetical protein
MPKVLRRLTSSGILWKDIRKFDPPGQNREDTTEIGAYSASALDSVSSVGIEVML